MSLAAFVRVKPDPLKGITIGRNSWRQRLIVMSFAKATGTDYRVLVVRRGAGSGPKVSAMLRFVATFFGAVLAKIVGEFAAKIVGKCFNGDSKGFR
jgi:hypothetical protein